MEILWALLIFLAFYNWVVMGMSNALWKVINLHTLSRVLLDA